MRPASAALLFCFLLESAAFAGPETSADAGQTAAVNRLNVPASVAEIEDVYTAPGAAREIYLIRDAHTNESAQKNLAGTLEALFEAEQDLRFVFVEAGSGDDSLSSLRDRAPLAQRRRAADAFLKKGILHGPEYLDLTADRAFTIWGVEDMELYALALNVYRDTAAAREQMQSAVKEIRRAADALKPRVFNPALLDLDEGRRRYQREEIPMTEWIRGLAVRAESLGVFASEYPRLASLEQLRRREETIDFSKAALERTEAIGARPAADREMLERLADPKNRPSRFSSGEQDEARAFYALLEEKLKTARPGAVRGELKKYFDYLREASQLDLRAVLAEQDALEARLYSILAVSSDETALVKADRTLDYWSRLFDLSLSADDFARFWERGEGFSLADLTGYLNRKLMEISGGHEQALFLEPGFNEAAANAEAFYALTRERDEAFVSNLTAKMDAEGQRKAVLVAGGYHTSHLKAILRRENISYVCLTPRVYQETNRRRYESILLNQQIGAAPGGTAPAAALRVPLMHINTLMVRNYEPYARQLVQEGLGLDPAVLTPASPVAGARQSETKPAVRTGYARIREASRQALRAGAFLLAAPAAMQMIQTREPGNNPFVLSAQAVTSSLVTDPVSASAGGLVTVPVRIQTNTDVSALQFDLLMPSQLSYQSGSVLIAGKEAVMAVVPPTSNRHRFLIYGMNATPIGFSTVVVNLTFYVKPDTAPNQTLTVPIVDAVYSSPAGNAVYAAPATDIRVSVTAPADTTPPSSPTLSLVSGSVTSSQIGLSWNRPYDNVGVTGYNVYFCLGGSCTASTLYGTTTGTSVTLTGLTPATTYRFRVRAVDAAGNLSLPSSHVSATTLAATTNTPPSISALSNLTVGMGASTGPIAFTLSDAQGTSNLTLSAVSSNTALVPNANIVFGGSGSSRTVTVTPAPSQSGTATITITATDPGGLTASASFVLTVNAISDTQAPSEPVLSVVAGSVTATQASLSWTKPYDNVGVTGYTLYMCQGSGCTASAAIGTTTVPSATVTGLTPATIYRFRVRARDAAGNLSLASSHVSITTAAAPAAQLAEPADEASRVFLAKAAEADRSDFEGAGATRDLALRAIDGETKIFRLGVERDKDGSFQVLVLRRNAPPVILRAYRGTAPAAAETEPAGSSDLVQTVRTHEAAVAGDLAQAADADSDKPVVVGARLALFGAVRDNPAFDVFTLSAYRISKLPVGKNVRIAFRGQPDEVREAVARVASLDEKYGLKGRFAAVFEARPAGQTAADADSRRVEIIPADEAPQALADGRFIPRETGVAGAIFADAATIRLAIAAGRMEIRSDRPLDPHFVSAYRRDSQTDVPEAILKEIVTGRAALPQQKLYAIKPLLNAALSSMYQWYRNMLSVLTAA
jgi:chitodextrinase